MRADHSGQAVQRIEDSQILDLIQFKRFCSIDSSMVTTTTPQTVPESTPTAGTERHLPGPALTRLRKYAQLSMLPFAAIDLGSGQTIPPSTSNLLPVAKSELLEKLADVALPFVHEFDSGLIGYALPLPSEAPERLIAFGYALDSRDTRPQQLVVAAAEAGWSEHELTQHLQQLPNLSAPQLRALLQLLASQLDEDQKVTKLSDELEQISDQLQETYEEITLLHSLTRNLQIHRGPTDVAKLCLDRMAPLIDCDANAIWLRDEADHSELLTRGTLPFDKSGLRRLVKHFENHDWSRPLVKNHIRGTLLGDSFPGLKSFVLVPITEGSHRSGWLISCNINESVENTNEPVEYGTVEASLLNSIATILGTHVRNIDLYQQHEDLMVEVVRSMVSTLDAKDPYTRGHSERVALVARLIGEQLHLPADDLDDIYLSGVLHDIGKIGIDDRILRKPGKLTDEEFEQIKKHPVIGYDILKGIKNLQHVLPGVRHHHEQYDGRGYPDGLVGAETPLMARILSVADAFDAMCSSRPYRTGMPRAKVESIFRSGRGSQWDPQAIDAYFKIADHIAIEWAAYSPEILLDSQ